jgi:ribose 5-phosphate isomerase
MRRIQEWASEREVRRGIEAVVLILGLGTGSTMEVVIK